MAENSRPPVAIRIVRPYGTDVELLENELDTIGKTSVILIGAQPRPTGVILRFEVTLASGATVLRGEGRVLSHSEDAFRGQPGLTLRFTRLDPKSKAIVDRATAMRDGRGPSSHPRMDLRAPELRSPSRPAPRPDSPIADALSAETPSPGAIMSAADQEAAIASARLLAREKANATARTNAKRTGRPSDLTPPPAPVTEQMLDSPEAEQSESAGPTPEPTPVTSIPGVVMETARVPVEVRESPPAVTAPPASQALRSKSDPLPTGAPPNRDALLARLRDRAGKLVPERIEEILATRRTR